MALAVTKIVVATLLPSISYLASSTSRRKELARPSPDLLLALCISLVSLVCLGSSWALSESTLVTNIAYLLLVVMMSLGVTLQSRQHLLYSLSTAELLVALMILAGSDRSSERIFLTPTVLLLFINVACLTAAKKECSQ